MCPHRYALPSQNACVFSTFDSMLKLTISPQAEHAETDPCQGNICRNQGKLSQSPTVGFHKSQSSNFQFESLKSEQINCGCFFDTMSDFNVPGSRPQKHDEISEIDRYHPLTSRPRALPGSGRRRVRGGLASQGRYSIIYYIAYYNMILCYYIYIYSIVVYCDII